MRNIDIIFEDESIIVCHKESGVAVQSKNIRQPDMEKLLLNELAKRGQKPEIYVVHRLDQPVEGVIVFAKTKAAAAGLSSQFKTKQMSKEYLAVVSGKFSEEKVHLEDYLLKNSKDNCSKVVDERCKNAKKAILNVEPIKTIENMQLVKIDLKTGRHHQIRVQLANAGHPIIGDTKYNPDYANQKGFFQTALCAYRLMFLHPLNNEKMEFTVNPTGESFKKFLNG